MCSHCAELQLGAGYAYNKAVKKSPLWALSKLENAMVLRPTAQFGAGLPRSARMQNSKTYRVSLFVLGHKVI